MKTIEEASNEFSKMSKYYGTRVALSIGFRKGVEFAQHWIPIEEELPLAYEDGDWDGLRSDYVLAKDSSGEWHKAQIYQGVIDGIEFVDWYSNTGWQLLNIVSWRPIEYK